MNINLAVVFAIGVIGYAAFSLYRAFSRQSKLANAYRREIRELVTNQKYQVKGRFE